LTIINIYSILLISLTKTKIKQGLRIMTNAQETITFSVPASEIADVDAFEQSRVKAYEGGDTASFNDLLSATTLKDGINLYEDVFDSLIGVDDPSAIARETVAKQRATVAKAAGGTVTYEVVLDTEANVNDIFRTFHLDQDTAATEAQQRMAERVPFGPKQNSSSFIHRPDTSKRHR
jgi:hypothetical protein